MAWRQQPWPLPSSMPTTFFSGWGQSKVVEDANKEMREKETKDTNNKTLRSVRQWDAIRSRG
eukprot:10411954-Alexandrium_andersonii.AAC.1